MPAESQSAPAASIPAMKRLLPATLLLLACVTTSPERALHLRAGEHVYPRPLAQLWPAVAAFLVERGYPLSKERLPAALATEWRPEPSRRGALRTRYVVEGAAAGAGATLHFFLEEEISPFQAGVYQEVDFERRPDISELGLRGSRRVEPAVRRERDLAAEWEFVERITPADAEQIRAEVAVSQPAR